MPIILFFLFLISSAFAQTKQILLSENNTVNFNQPFKGDFVAKKTQEALLKSILLPKGQALYIVLDTPGGSVVDGLLFIDALKSLNRPIHTITIFAASMGYQVVQSLGNRYILSSGSLMSHRGAAGGLSGQVPGELNSRLAHLEDILLEMNKIASKRVKLSLEEYQRQILNELWVTGSRAVQKGHADEVVNVQCAPDLIRGTYSDSFSTIFGQVNAKFSKCPLITSPISISFGALVKNQEAAKQELFKQKRRVFLEY
jgi:ATP-dependent protease ClpP protease subunit